MKRLLFALLLVSSTASADSQLSLRSNGLKLDSGTTPPSNCTTGTLCLWRNGNALTLRATDGTDAWSVTGGPPSLSLADGVSAPVSSANTGSIRYNDTTHTLQQSLNTGSWSDIGGGGGTVTADSPLTGNGSSGSHLACATCVVTGGSTMTGPFVLSGSQTGTYSLGGTPSLAAALAVTTDSTNVGDATHRINTFGLTYNAGASTATYKGWSAADSASAIGHIFDTTTAFATSGGRYVSIRSGGTEKLWMGPYPAVPSLSVLYNLSNTGILFQSNSDFYVVIGGTPATHWTAAAMTPQTDFGQTAGNASFRYSEVWSRQHIGVEQTIAAAATISIDPASGETVRITLSATAITTVNGAAGKPGETIRVEVIQDGTGGRAISGWATGTNGFLLAGGTYTPTSTLSKRDVLTFAWDATSSRWVETSRSLNL